MTDQRHKTRPKSMHVSGRLVASGGWIDRRLEKRQGYRTGLGKNSFHGKYHLIGIITARDLSTQGCRYEGQDRGAGFRGRWAARQIDAPLVARPTDPRRATLAARVRREALCAHVAAINAVMACRNAVQSNGFAKTASAPRRLAELRLN